MRARTEATCNHLFAGCCRWWLVVLVVVLAAACAALGADQVQPDATSPEKGLFDQQMPAFDLPVVPAGPPPRQIQRTQRTRSGAKGRLASLLGFGNLPDDLDISGSQMMTFRKIDVSGSGASNYYNQFWDSETFETRTDLYMRGRLYKEFYIDAVFASGTFNPNRNHYALTYKGHDTQATYGFINAELGGNRYLTLNKTLKGYKVETTLLGKYPLTFFTTRSQGAVKKEVFAGNGTSGPYFLRYTPLREGSEEVRVDEKLMVFGRDYKLNYITGELDFKQGMIIPPSSKISVSYEQSLTGEGGKLDGYALELPLSSKLRLNLSRAEQDSGHTGVLTPQITYAEDNYLGNNSTGPFVMIYRPIMRSVRPVVFHTTGAQLTGAGTTTPSVTVTPGMVGPYLDGKHLYYAGTQQVPARVFVGGIMQSEGSDYVISYDTSTVTFLKAIPDLLPVEIDYFVLNPNGTILINGEVKQAVTVYVDGIKQFEGSDYIITYDTGVLQFTDNVPLNARVLLQYYYYKQPETYSGLRRVDGLTAEYKFNDELNLQLQFARSNKRFDPTQGIVPSGAARMLKGTYNTDRLSLACEYESVDDTFSRLNSVGFLRNETGIKYNLDYKLKPGLTFFRNFSHKKSDTPLYFGLGSGYSSTQSTYYAYTLRGDSSNTTTTVEQDSLGLNYSRPGRPSMRLIHNRLSNSSTTSGASEQTSDQLSLSHRFGTLTTTLSLRQSKQRGSALDLQTGELLPPKLQSKSNSYLASVTYNPSQQLVLNLTHSRSTTDTYLQTTSSSKADTTTAALTYYPTQQLSLRLSESYSSTSGAVGYTYLGGSSYYAPSILSGREPEAASSAALQAPLQVYFAGLGRQESYQVEKGKTKQRRRTVDVQYNVSKTLNLGLSYTDRLYTSEGSIGYQSDNDAKSWGLIATWQPRRNTSLYLNYNKDKVVYLGENASLVPTDSEIVAVGLSTKLKQRLALNSVLQIVTSTSPGYQTTSALDTNLTSFYLNADYSLSEKASVSGRLEFSTSDTSEGLYGNYDKWVYSLSYNRAVTDILTLSLGSEYVNYTDKSDSRGNYKTLLFFGQVGLRFD